MTDIHTVLKTYKDAFSTHDPSGLAGILAKDIVVERAQGGTADGHAAALELWTAIATDTGGEFDIEDEIVAGELAVLTWTFRYEGGFTRGANLLKIRDGRVYHAVGYTKTN
ncbi:nuclear transport factor 2 family protein [Phytomonospora sp. NPDC050363]|uniref:nuclear transport factor 2 family protein n=1 Tax=Phytomonospora sp. NPDC050363 TaxID=3155642 RepID=UPI0033C79CC4